ncbi:DUF4190 domain-containing protein [Streptomyces sp. NPDC013953]|uniref:DUF4190 domain-containing protein n=1 Tax=Streptomyces sp. NPDC013953 TaxID=3364868 RepID=UPI0036F5EBBF
MEPSAQGWPPPQQYHPAYGMPGPPGAPGPLPPAAPDINGLAIASLVAGILCCVPPLGMILGAAALVRIRKKGERGKGLAVAGMIMSLVGTLLLTAGLATGVLREAYDGFREAADEAGRTRSTFDLRKGQCFNTPGGAAEAETADVEVVPCSEPHDGEITGSFKLTGLGDGWPGDEPIEAAAEERCATVNRQYAMDAWAVPENAWLFYYQPSRQSWRIGDRTVSCAFAAERDKLTGSLRSDAAVLDPHQLAYLKAVNPIDDVLADEPEEDVEEDLAANAEWAGDVEKALAASVSALEGHTWPAASRKGVTDLVEELEGAREHWAKAAGAADPEVFWEHYEPGYDALPYDLGSTVRGTLGLSDTPPDEPGDPESDPEDPGDGENGGAGAETGGAAV